MNKVRPKRLGDLITFKRGYDLPGHSRTPGPYPVISSAGVSGYHNEYKVEGEGGVTGRHGTLDSRKRKQDAHRSLQLAPPHADERPGNGSIINRMTMSNQVEFS